MFDSFVCFVFKCNLLNVFFTLLQLVLRAAWGSLPVLHHTADYIFIFFWIIEPILILL